MNFNTSPMQKKNEKSKGIKPFVQKVNKNIDKENISFLKAKVGDPKESKFKY